MSKKVFEIGGNVEQKIKSDDLLSRQSLIFREINGIKYLIIDGSEEAMEKLGKEFNLKVAENEDIILKEVEREEEKAVQGFGNIFG